MKISHELEMTCRDTPHLIENQENAFLEGLFSLPEEMLTMTGFYENITTLENRARTMGKDGYRAYSRGRLLSAYLATKNYRAEANL